MNSERGKIASEYAKAVKQSKRGMVSATSNALFADYTDSELPPELLETSFGCGNPVLFSAIEPGQTVIDLGCGAGLDLLLAADKVGPSGAVIGVDMAEAMLDKARERIVASGYSNIDVRKGEIENLPIRSGTVDWVISNCVINLSPNKDQAFSEIWRVLKPGGRMLVSDIVAENMPFWVRRSGVLTAACAGGAISESEYLTRLGDANLVNAQVLARQHYDPFQLSAVGLDSIPKRIADLSCCGKAVTKVAFQKLARPISEHLWSARIFAQKSTAN